MTPSPIQYGSGIISIRSRRLRTIAAVLLIAVLGMAAYGTRVLVPRVNRAAAAAAKPISPTQVSSTLHAAPRITTAPLNLTKKQAQLLRFDVVFVAAYWVVWIMLVLSLLIIAWLDLREVSRTYLDRRRELWAVASNSAEESSPISRAGSNPKHIAASDLDDSSGPSVGS